MFDGFDWKSPNYAEVFKRRVEKLNRIRANPYCLPALKVFYRHNPIQFLQDWATTADPRNIELALKLSF